MSEDKKFIIGGFEFENYYEYRAAQEDVQKIEYINEELDIQDPEVALRLYSDIRDGIITFNSPIGQQFADHVGDIVANKSQGLLEERELLEEAEGQAKNQRVLGRLFVFLAIGLLAVFAGVEIKDVYETRQIAQMKEELDKNSEEKSAENSQDVKNNSDTNIEDIVSEDDDTAQNADYSDLGKLITSPWDTSYEEENLTMLSEFVDLYATNQDLVGWLEVVDTDINYPVMQTPTDPEYYLRRDFNGNSDSNGTLFVDYRCDTINPTTNTIIYGHNMKSGKMFGGLKSFLKEDYYNSHKTIIFKTLYFEEEYEIVAVGLSEVGYNDDGNYKYYDFIDAVTEGELQEYIDNIKSMAVYDDTDEINYHDKLLTLSTCNSYTEDGRLFVVARRVK